jgi:hypothetical protein
VGAREVLKRLAQFYTSAEGTAERIRIELHSGSCVPEFTFAEPGARLPETGLRPIESLPSQAMTTNETLFFRDPLAFDAGGDGKV